MTYTPEIFKQRSFEVVWAVFRVAGVCGRPAITRALEDSALAYLVHKDISTLTDLQEVVLLGVKVGEIHETNAKILEREMNELYAFLSQPHTSISSVPPPVSLDEVFAEPPVLFSTLSEQIKADVSEALQRHGKGRNGSSAEVYSPASDFPESGNDISDYTHHNHVKSEYNNSVSFSGNSPEMIFPESGNDISGKHDHKNTGEISGTSGNENMAQPLTSAQRKEFIVGLLKDKQFCHINDLLTHLPGVSDRTIRNDIKSLVDSRIIERLGNGGPNSFFRLRKNAS